MKAVAIASRWLLWVLFLVAPQLPGPERTTCPLTCAAGSAGTCGAVPP